MVRLMDFMSDVAESFDFYGAGDLAAAKRKMRRQIQQKDFRETPLTA
jgi:hypothetical protein